MPALATKVGRRALGVIGCMASSVRPLHKAALWGCQRQQISTSRSQRGGSHPVFRRSGAKRRQPPCVASGRRSPDIVREEISRCYAVRIAVLILRYYTSTQLLFGGTRSCTQSNGTVLFVVCTRTIARTTLGRPGPGPDSGRVRKIDHNRASFSLRGTTLDKCLQLKKLP
eukprot:scaffold334115_cov20-Prasinocladus_malaysianus.AAC.1